MKRLIIAATLVVATSFVAVILAAVRQPLKAINELPEHLLPGHSLPPGVSCAWDYSWSAITYCTVPGRGPLIYLYYNRETGKIITAEMYTSETTIGDLINAWGTPTSMKQYSYAAIVYWGTRSAWVYTSHIRPTDDLVILQYHEVADQTRPWRGFAK